MDDERLQRRMLLAGGVVAALGVTLLWLEGSWLDRLLTVVLAVVYVLLLGQAVRAWRRVRTTLAGPADWVDADGGTDGEVVVGLDAGRRGTLRAGALLLAGAGALLGLALILLFAEGRLTVTNVGIGIWGVLMLAVGPLAVWPRPRHPVLVVAAGELRLPEALCHRALRWPEIRAVEHRPGARRLRVLAGQPGWLVVRTHRPLEQASTRTGRLRQRAHRAAHGSDAAAAIPTAALTHPEATLALLRSRLPGAPTAAP